MNRYQYDFILTGIPFRWYVPFEMELDKRYLEFVSNEDCVPEIIWDIRFGELEYNPEQTLREWEFCKISVDKEYQYWSYPCDRKELGEAFTLVRKQDDYHNYRLYLPENVKEEVKTITNWLAYMAFEEAMYVRGRILLHASYIDTPEGAILFSGPSGAGKSTQAKLWEKYAGAVIQNGDRTILFEENGRIIASGSPYAGSSKIYRNHQSPVRAVIVLEHGEENELVSLKGLEAYSSLYRECTYPYMNGEMRIKQSDVLCRLIETVPVYHYRCTKDLSAVEVLQRELEQIETDYNGEIKCNE